MRRTEARVLITPEEDDRFLPEGPRDHSDLTTGNHGIGWVNIQRASDPARGDLHFHNFEPPGDSDLWTQDCPGRPGFFLPTVDPGVSGGDGLRMRDLVGIEKSLYLYHTWEPSWHKLATIPDANPRTIINDAEIVPGGKAVVFGTKDTKFDSEAKLAQLYLYTVDDNRISVLADKQVCSNGKALATDARGLILFDIDTPTRKVVRYRLDVAARTATPDGVALDLANQIGFPDGMRGCGDGTAIIAFYNPEFAEAGRAVRFNLTTGEVIEEWLTPGSPRVTCPLLLKRPDGVKLILTTATEGMPAEMRAKCPNAGCLFIADTQFADCPEPEVVRLA
jgi:sugar lactone lactonase YvrE